jgi:hypothetical protein
MWAAERTSHWPFWISQCIALAVYGGMLWVLKHKDVRALFNASNRLWWQMLIAPLVVWVLTVVAFEWNG